MHQIKIKIAINHTALTKSLEYLETSLKWLTVPILLKWLQTKKKLAKRLARDYVESDQLETGKRLEGDYQETSKTVIVVLSSWYKLLPDLSIHDYVLHSLS